MANKAMKKYAKMRMVYGDHGTSNPHTESYMEPAYMDYGADARFRDKRGREHYDNGKYAPRSAMGWHDGMESRMGAYGEPEDRRYRRSSDGRFRAGMDGMEKSYPGKLAPVWREDTRMAMNPIGFNPGREMEYNYHSDAGYYPRSETEYVKGDMSEMGHASSRKTAMTKEMAEEWVGGMTNEDGTKGAHWTMDQVKQLMAQKGIQANPIHVWTAMNMLYSDYCAVLKKYNVNKAEFVLDLACAFLNDKDVTGDKLAKYYECVVEG